MSDAPFGFRLKVYPNPMRDDGVFVAEDKPIEPYPPPNDHSYPAIPKTDYALDMQLPHEFAKEIVRRWNLGSPSEQRFATDDYRELADSLRREKDNSVLLHTLFSNNFNLILGALDTAPSASARAPKIDTVPNMLARLRRSAHEQQKRDTYTWIAPGHVLAVIDTIGELEAENARLNMALEKKLWDAILEQCRRRAAAREPQPVVGSPDAWRG